MIDYAPEEIKIAQYPIKEIIEMMDSLNVMLLYRNEIPKRDIQIDNVRANLDNLYKDSSQRYIDMPTYNSIKKLLHDIERKDLDAYTGYQLILSRLMTDLSQSVAKNILNEYDLYMEEQDYL